MLRILKKKRQYFLSNVPPISEKKTAFWKVPKFLSFVFLLPVACRYTAWVLRSQAVYRQATRNSHREWQYHRLHVFNCILLKMSSWGSKHVEENNILWINNNQCIKLVNNIECTYRNTKVRFRHCGPAMYANKIALHCSAICLTVDLGLQHVYFTTSGLRYSTVPAECWHTQTVQHCYNTEWSQSNLKHRRRNVSYSSFS